MASIQEMSHDQFEQNLARVIYAGRRVGLWTRAQVTITDTRPPRRFWRRRRLDAGRVIVYVRRARRDPALVLADIRRAVVSHAGPDDLTADQRVTRAAALRRLTQRDPSC